AVCDWGARLAIGPEPPSRDDPCAIRPAGPTGAPRGTAPISATAQSWCASRPVDDARRPSRLLLFLRTPRLTAGLSERPLRYLRLIAIPWACGRFGPLRWCCRDIVAAPAARVDGTLVPWAVGSMGPWSHRRPRLACTTRFTPAADAPRAGGGGSRIQPPPGRCTGPRPARSGSAPRDRSGRSRHAARSGGRCRQTPGRARPARDRGARADALAPPRARGQ